LIGSQAVTATIRLLGALALSAHPAFFELERQRREELHLGPELTGESDDFWTGMAWHGFWYW
jgi:hypothetical protein